MSTTEPANARANATSTVKTQPMIGESSSMVSCRRRIERFIAFDAPILIDGETGTGKDLAARAIHNRSARCAGYDKIRAKSTHSCG